MLISIINSDKSKAAESARQIVLAKTKTDPELVTLELDAKSFLQVSMDELLHSNALFKSKYIVLLDDILQDKDASDKFFDYLQSISQSQHLFILKSSSCTHSKKQLETLEKYALKSTVECAPPKKSANNAFLLADKIFLSDKKEAWLTFQRLSLEFEAENLYGIVNWAFKNLFIFKKDPEALKPYLRQKSDRILKLHDFDKIKSAYRDFLFLPQRAREANQPLKDHLEKWILSLNIKKN